VAFSELIKPTFEPFLGQKIKSAFPAYRVFIFGQEVTSDVLDVRVNNSGGSAERSAGTCSFTLVNPDNKYTLTYGDILLIAESAAAYRETRRTQWADNGFGGTTPSEVQALQRQAEKWQAANKLPAEHQELLTDYTQQGREAELPQELLDAAKRIDKNLVENKDEVENTYKELARSMTASSYADPFSALNLESFTPQVDGKATTKARVLTEKINFFSDVTYDSDNSLAQLEDRTLMQYPFQQGDCVFSPNDPVRVAFRDPFDPRVWYWMFTGFMDAWTENSGVNMDSTLTINCTDVTKMARYSFIQIGVGLQDPNIEDIFSQIDPTTQASKQVQYFGQLFAGFTMLEALDTLFFGTESAQDTVEDVIHAQMATMTDEALTQYLATIDPAFIDPSNPGYLNTRAIQVDAATQAKAAVRQKAIDQAGKLPPLSVPAPFMKNVEKGDATTEDYEASSGTIVAKKKSNRWGVHAYFYGEMTEYDKALGEGIVSLNWWNELLHHRVRVRDLVDLALNEGEYRQQLLGPGVFTTSMIIGLIGEGKKKFPVGHGRVFYVSRAQLADGRFGREVIDRSMGGNSGLFSIFKDKLSYIYDMVDRVDFRFYATPKGDFVYEMPFYDFDPIYFTSDSMEDWELKPAQVQEYLMEGMSGGVEAEALYSARDLEAIGFFKDYEAAEKVQDWSAAGPYDYQKHFTIEREEQLSFSNTATDQGVATVFRCRPQNVASLDAINGGDIKKFQYVADKGALLSLGVRVAEADAWGFITTEEEAEMYAGLMLSRLNAEAKNVSVATLPKFGLMVNRPLFWRERNYYANIVSLQHSIVWASSADTKVNLNQLRGWSGETHKITGYPIHRHFSGADRPFSMGDISKKSTSNQNTQGES